MCPLFLLQLFYNLAFFPIVLFFAPHFLYRMIQRGNYGRCFSQRFGYYRPELQMRFREGPWTWVHAVSVGEVLIALKLIRQLQVRHPSWKFVLSTTTSTAFVLAHSECRGELAELQVVYQPLDFILFVQQALNQICPERLILIEAEVWPNLVLEAKARGIPCFLVNARLSYRSERRFQRIRWLIAPLFNQLQFIGIVDPQDRKRWMALGVPSHKIQDTGSIKFDDAASEPHLVRDFTPLLRKIGIPEGAPVLLGASTHAGEEVGLGRVFQALKSTFPDLFLILVPRHFERAEGVKSELEAEGLKVQLRSQLKEEFLMPEGNVMPELAVNSMPPDVLVVDTTGELRDWYRVIDLAVVGKSFLADGAQGGQNPAEPLNAGRATLFGPYMQNFDILVQQLVQAQGAQQVSSFADLQQAILDLLNQPQMQVHRVAAGKAVLARHSGATIRTCEMIEGSAE